MLEGVKNMLESVKSATEQKEEADKIVIQGIEKKLRGT